MINFFILIVSILVFALITKYLYFTYRPISFRGKTVFITGSSTGIGEQMAKEFNRLEANVIISGRNMQDLQRVQKQLKNCEIFQLDLSDSSKIMNLTKDFFASHKIDILINNAGISQRSLTVDSLETIEIERYMMEVNYFSVIALTKSFIKSLNGRHATIAVVSSTAGIIPSIGSSGYSAAKCGIIGYFSSIRAELKDLGINVVNMAPGYVNTNITLRAVNSKMRELGFLDPRNKKGIEPDAFAKMAIRDMANGKTQIIITSRKTDIIILLASINPKMSSLWNRKLSSDFTKKILRGK